MKNLKVGINAAYFHQDKLPAAVKKLVKAGFRKIEFNGAALRNIGKDDLAALCSFMDAEGVSCAAINAVPDLMPVSLGNLIALQSGERQRALDHVKQCLEFAGELCASRMVCDLGTSTEDAIPLSRQNEIFLESLNTILDWARADGVSIVLLNVPGRRWIGWDILPPDPARVVERYVPPWRLWPNEEDLLKDIGGQKGRVLWGFDTANAVVAHGSTPFTLVSAVTPYFEYGLDVVYLANHPGPYNKVWHRLLLHQPLYDGCFAASDYAALFDALGVNNFSGELILQIREKQPSMVSLRKSIDFIKKLNDII